MGWSILTAKFEDMIKHDTQNNDCTKFTKSSPGQEFRQLLGRCLTNGCVAIDPFQ